MPGLLQNLRQKLRSTKPRPRSARPAVEGLEDRMLLFATNGGLWTYPIRVTYSFAPDGTSIGGVPSNMFATFNSTQSQATWQGAIKQAAALWENVANVNLALVSDSGAALGVSGNQQDDPRFGDIRFSAIPEGGGVLASADLPPPFNGGTAAGDITFNSSINWSPSSGYDVESVALHEFGHALGLDHSALMTAVMYQYYTGTNQNPTSDDISGIDSVYGPVKSPTESNRSIATAINLTSSINSSGQLAVANLALLGNQDTNWWYFVAPSNTTGTLTVQMQATSLSSLAPKLVVYNGSKVLVGTSSMPDAYGATAAVTVTGVSAGQGFYVRCMSASGIGSNGAYGLLANFGSSSQSPIAPPNTVVLQQADQGGGSSNILVSNILNLASDVLPWWNSAVTSPWWSSGLGQLVSTAGGGSWIHLGNLVLQGDYLEIAPAAVASGFHHTTDTAATPTQDHTSTPLVAALPPTTTHPTHPKPGGAGPAYPNGAAGLSVRHRFRPTQ